MFLKVTRIIFTLISIVYMLSFALPKLQSMPVSVKSFTMFSTVLPIDATVFMYFTGVIELLIALLLIFSLFIKKIDLKKKLGLSGFFLLLATMIGAILIEQFVRVTPVPKLMTIALVLIVISIYELNLLSQKKEIENDSN